MKPEGVKVNGRRPNPAEAGPGAENLPLISALCLKKTNDKWLIIYQSLLSLLKE
jgi:hypothetical protein